MSWFLPLDQADWLEPLPKRRRGQRGQAIGSARRLAVMGMYAVAHRRCHACQQKCAISTTAGVFGVPQSKVYEALAHVRRHHAAWVAREQLAPPRIDLFQSHQRVASGPECGSVPAVPDVPRRRAGNG